MTTKDPLCEHGLKRYDHTPRRTDEPEKLFTLADDSYFVTFRVYADAVNVQTDWSWDPIGNATLPRDQARRVYVALKAAGYTLYAGHL